MPKATTVSSLTRAKDFGSSQASVDRRDVGQAHRAAAADRNFRRRQILDGFGAAQRADRLLAVAEFALAAGHVGVHAAQRLVDVARRDAERHQLARVELDLDFALDAAVAVDARDALQALQLADHRVVDEPGQFLDRHLRRRHGISQDRLPFDVDRVHDRIIRRCRQVAANALDGVLDVAHRLGVSHVHAEFDNGRSSCLR